jgi:hypothetical protein
MHYNVTIIIGKERINTNLLWGLLERGHLEDNYEDDRRLRRTLGKLVFDLLPFPVARFCTSGVHSCGTVARVLVDAGSVNISNFYFLFEEKNLLCTLIVM